MCELTKYSCSVRVSRYDLLTAGSVIIFIVLGLLSVCAIINSYETVIQISTYHLQVDAFQIFGIIPLAYLKSAFDTQRNYSMDFSRLCIIFGVLMRAMEIYIN